jgi:hypothetical protein
MPKVFSAGQTKQIATIVTDVLKQAGLVAAPPIASNTGSSNVQEMEDPSLAPLFEAEAKLVGQMVDPVIKVVRGRRGTRMINQTLEQLNAVRDMIKDRKTWRTSQNI